MHRDDDIPPAMRDALAAQATVKRILDTWSDKGPTAGRGASIPADIDADALLSFYESGEMASSVWRLRGGYQLRYPAAIAAIAALAEASLMVLAVGLRDLDTLDAAGANEALAEAGTSVGELARALGMPDVGAAVHLRACFAARSAGLLDLAAYAAERAAAAAAVCRPVPRDLMTVAQQNRGITLIELGRADEGLVALRAARDFEDDLGGLTHIDNAIAGGLLRIGEYDQAVHWFEANERALQALAPGDGLDRAQAMETLANALHLAGDADRAVARYEEAWQLLDGTDTRRGYQVALGRSSAAMDAGDTAVAYASFELARELAKRDVARRLRQDDFRAGFDAAIQALAAEGSPVWPLLDTARAVSRSSGIASAMGAYSAARMAARQAGDRATELTCAVLVAQGMSEDGAGPVEVDAILTEIRGEAISAAIPTVAAMADSGIVVLMTVGLEASATGLDRLYLAIEALYLSQASEAFAAAKPDEVLDRLTPANPGIALMTVGDAATEAGAYDIAVEHCWEALRQAERAGDPGLEVMRASALLELFDEVEAPAHLVDPVVRRMTELLPGVGAAPTVRARLALCAHFSQSQPQRALEHAREAAEAAGLGTQSAGRGEHEVRRQEASRALLLQMIACGEPDAATFAVLQGGRAVALMRELAQSTGSGEYAPPDAREAQRLISGLPTRTAFIDVVETRGGLRAYILDAEGLRTVDVAGDRVPLHAPDYGDVRRRAAQVVRLVGSSQLLRDLVSAIEREVPGESALLVAMDDDLSNLPIFAVPFAGGVWADRRSISRIPAVAHLRYVRERREGVGALVAGDSAGDLPHANAECIDVADFLGVDAITGARCTLAAVTSVMEGGELDIVHLAVHGRADALRGGRTSLQFAADDGQTEWIGFDDLRALSWRANLIVFSGCSTAVGGPRHGRGLYGIAQAAAAAGAATVLATLWPVDDASARVFMTRFYRELARAREGASLVDLRPVVDRARAALREWLRSRAGELPTRLRDGRDLAFDLGAPAGGTEIDGTTAEALHWAPFVLIGNPIVRFADA